MLNGLANSFFGAIRTKYSVIGNRSVLVTIADIEPIVALGIDVLSILVDIINDRPSLPVGPYGYPHTVKNVHLQASILDLSIHVRDQPKKVLIIGGWASSKRL